MPTIHIRFPGGRYHATPGGHHVNEGQIEWPPSPWRLLRAFIATGYTALGWDKIPVTGETLLTKLASVLPVYRLPPACAAHSRHYMPLGILEKGREKTTLVFDTWADVGDDCIAINWPVELCEREQEVLGELASHLSYLGRSESWVEAALVEDHAETPVGKDSLPCEADNCPGPEYEQIAITAPLTADAYADWRDPLVKKALAGYPLTESKKPTKKLLKDRQEAEAAYPTSLLDALQWDTARWKEYRWGQPPGSRRVLYWRHADALQVGTPTLRHSSPAPVECMLLALATPSRNHSALPTVARALPQAELLHRALVAKAGNGNPVDCAELTGTDLQANPLQGHKHAHIIPVDLDDDGHLDHVLIYARMGLGAVAQRTIRSVRKTWQKKGSDLQVVVIGGGTIHDMRGLPEELRPGVERLLGSNNGSIAWQSATPFVPPRFPKKRGHNTVEGQVQSELCNLGYPPARVTILPWDMKNASLRHAVRVRSGKANPPPVDCGYVLELIFERPVVGPICLGYASHFGLGLFAAKQE